jgi:hypothetical protein
MLSYYYVCGYRQLYALNVTFKLQASGQECVSNYSNNGLFSVKNIITSHENVAILKYNAAERPFG